MLSRVNARTRPECITLDSWPGDFGALDCRWKGAGREEGQSQADGRQWRRQVVGNGKAIKSQNIHSY